MSDPTPRATDAALVRALGIWGLAASIVNITIGGGIFGLPARAAAALGPAAPLAYLVCAVAMGLIALCIAEAGSRVAATGGPYAYIEVAFGPFVGFLAGTLLWLIMTTALAAVAALFVASVARLDPAGVLSTAVARATVLAVLFAALAAINARGVRQGVGVSVVMTIAKLAPLLLLIAVGAFSIRLGNLQWTSTPAPRDVAGASLLVVFAFAGIESALVPSGEVSAPERTVPRAILIAMLVVTGTYMALQLVAQGVLGPDLARFKDTPLAEAAGRVMGPWGRSLLLMAAIVSMLGYVSGMMLAVPRALFAFARDGFLPDALARVHPEFHTPWVAIVAQAAISCVLAASGTFEFLVVLSNVGVLLLYAGCCLAAWRLRRWHFRSGGRPFHAPAGTVVPIVACALIAFILSSLPLREMEVVGGVLIGASGLFVATARRRKALVVDA